jgi:hypothetical protein
MRANAAVESGAMSPDDDVPVKDFAICALDVLSGMCEGTAADNTTPFFLK